MEGAPADAVALAGLGAALGLSNILTATLAYPMAKRAGSPMRQAAQGYGSYTFGGILASLAGTAVAASSSIPSPNGIDEPLASGLSDPDI